MRTKYRRGGKAFPELLSASVVDGGRVFTSPVVSRATKTQSSPIKDVARLREPEEEPSLAKALNPCLASPVAVISPSTPSPVSLALPFDRVGEEGRKPTASSAESTTSMMEDGLDPLRLPLLR